VLIEELLVEILELLVLAELVLIDERELELVLIDERELGLDEDWELDDNEELLVLIELADELDSYSIKRMLSLFLDEDVGPGN
jgi:hypothetical protein